MEAAEEVVEDEVVEKVEEEDAIEEETIVAQEENEEKDVEDEGVVVVELANLHPMSWTKHPSHHWDKKSCGLKIKKSYYLKHKTQSNITFHQNPSLFIGKNILTVPSGFIKTW